MTTTATTDTAKPNADAAKADDTATAAAAAATKDGAKADDKKADDAAATKTVDTGTDDTAAKGDTKRVVPESYSLKAPEGAEMDPTVLKDVAFVAKANGWTNEEAQAAVDLQHALIGERATSFRKELADDKEVGGKNLDTTMRSFNTGLDRIYPKGDPDGDAFRAMLKATGYDNHRLVVKHFAKLAKMTGEDGHVGGSASGEAQPASRAERMYPSKKK